MAEKNNGNPHRARGTGRGTASAWNNRGAGLEGEPVRLEVLTAQTKSMKESNVLDLNLKRPDPPKAGEFHAGPEIGGGAILGEEGRATQAANAPDSVPETPLQANDARSEIKEPKYVIEKALVMSIRDLYGKIKVGLDLIREINSKEKKWKVAESIDKNDAKKINLAILNKIFLVNPDDEKFLAEIERLRDFEKYDIASLREKITSHPEVIALKNSAGPVEEKEEEYEKLVKRIVRHEVVDIFKNDEIAGAGEAVKIALYLEGICRKGLIEIEANPSHENMEAAAELAEVPKTFKEQQKEDFVRQILANNSRLQEIALSSIGKKMVPGARLLEIINKIRSDEVEQEILDFVRGQEPEKSDSFIELDMLVDSKLGEIIARDFGNFLSEGQKMAAESKEKEKNIEEIFSSEQLEKLDQVANALRTNYLKEIEDARGWSSGWRGEEGQEKAKNVIQIMKWASARETYDVLVRSSRFPLMHKPAAVQHMLEKIFEE